jgi:membrane fusion protein (multidrug efflux system)
MSEENNNNIKQNRKKRIMVIAMLVGVLLIGLPLSIKWGYYRFTHAITNNAFVESDLVTVSPLIQGHVKTVFVDEGDFVKEGQLLMEIEDTEYLKKVQLNEAQMEQARKERSRAETAHFYLTVTSPEEIRKAEHGLKADEAELERIGKDYFRFKALYESGAIAGSKLDDITTALEKMRNKVEASNALLKQAQATRYQIEQSKKGIEAASAAVQTTEKALEIARVTLGYTKVRSPLEGVIAKKFVDTGDFISPGAPAFTVYNKQNIYITANLEETKIARVKVGQEVDVKVDAYKKTLKGKVIKIGEASGAKFALIPRDTSAGEFTKVVQRLPVKIMVINNPDDYPLKPGLSVSAAIKVK